MARGGSLQPTGPLGTGVGRRRRAVGTGHWALGCGHAARRRAVSHVTRSEHQSVGSDRARSGAGAGGAARALAVCVIVRTRGEVPELALQRGDRHRVQANKPNTTHRQHYKILHRLSPDLVSLEGLKSSS